MRLQRSDSRARAGDYRRAADEAEQLALPEQLSGAVLYHLSCVYARCAAAAGRFAARPLPEREKRAEGCAKQAVALLKRGAEASLFHDPKNIAHLDKDPDLAA